jgi:glycosyltransferase involved in cell wall biosynthesis
VVPSLAVKRFLVGQRRIKDSKIIHIPNGLDDFKVKLIPQGQVIGFIGSFNKNKGLPILISAMNKVKEEIPSVRLELVGAGDLRSVSGGQAQILGSTIVFLDQIDTIAEIMGGWRLLVVPSLTEAFGQVAVEAGIAGLPAVVSNAGGLPEIISNGVNGLVVPRGNICKLSDAIVEILQNQSLAGKMGRQNRLVYEKCFTAVLMGQRFSSLYEKSYD